MSVTGKLFVKFIFAVLFIGLIAPFAIIKGSDGRPIMSYASVMENIQLTWHRAQFKYNELKSELLSTELLTEKGVDSFKTTQLYRWYDEEGTLSYGDNPHPVYGGESMEVQPVMTIKSFKPQVAAPLANNTQNNSKRQAASKTEKSNEDDEEGFSLTTVPMAEIPELIQQAKRIQKISDDRAKAFEGF